MQFGRDARLPLPALELIPDPSDNWSHGIDRFGEGVVARPVWEPPVTLAAGPCMASLLQLGTIGHSTLRAEWRVYADEPFIELRLRVHWMARQQIVKLVLPLPAAPDRTDGIPGAALRRANDGRERPLRDWTLIATGAAAVGIVCPAVYALDVTPQRARFTLLRSPVMTHHDPNPGNAPGAPVSDQGEHEFVFRFFAGPEVSERVLENCAHMMNHPLLTADLTRGMPRR